MHRVEVAADLQIMSSHCIPRRETVVIAQLEAALIELLGRAVASQTAAALEVQSNQAGIERRRVPAVLLQAQRGFVERVAVIPLVARCSSVNPVPEIRR